MGEVQGEEVKMIDVQQQGPASENLCGAFVFRLCDDLLTTRESTPTWSNPHTISLDRLNAGCNVSVRRALAALLLPQPTAPTYDNKINRRGRYVPAANLSTPPRGTEKHRGP